ncbi:MAG: bifunctional D-glycero-beta-D-manno-heptose-7-phosphate kinase/D-glycero-beta-D-manno-heptose 1-phosphate adenylyltransferase HldE [Cellvibrionales bacterium]|nr:bifunctional D-glycero-beta-D-manno-heptose-7-phosphate kinase/D-glycero-beta-D-manno-heptose 1-phosphate adenylyltransferase HldE [Cellvibrionales bacterium]
MTSSIDRIDLTQCQFPSAKLLFIGDVMLDQYWTGNTQRISPEAPVPVINIQHNQERLGGAANAALNARTLGAKVSIAGILGKDSNGEIVKRLLDDAGITQKHHESLDEKTITKLRIISQNQQMIRADFETPFSQANSESITDALITQLDTYQAIVLSDYNKGTLANCERIIQRAKTLDIPVIVDPKGTDFSRYHGATLLTPNLSEFEAIVGKCQDKETLIDKAQALIQTLDLEALLVTLSENGMMLCRKDGGNHHYNALAREVFDVTGAGDTVIATLATAIAAGIELEKATALANTAASIVVGRLGAAQVSLLDLQVALDQHQHSHEAIMDEDELLAVVNFEKSLGKKIVFTNGCFDILHKGHTAYLSEAKALGDRLIVAVNDDDSIRRLKGNDRPINPLEDRMSLLASLASVDFVVPFSKNTPCDLLTKLKPDILVKGGDYTLDEVVGGDIVLANQGQINVLSLQQGRSTTQIIDTIIKRHQDID